MLGIVDAIVSRVELTSERRRVTVEASCADALTNGRKISARFR